MSLVKLVIFILFILLVVGVIESRRQNLNSNNECENTLVDQDTETFKNFDNEFNKF